ncbi:hypothetical protein SDC9_119010 [bioreactor metagenome]|uniref:Uncharacterized protein n=1 Tax=bioreactor metagenome TaxID=1076179 RepID=A0A645C4A6_9ZZZZ
MPVVNGGENPHNRVERTHGNVGDLHVGEHRPGLPAARAGHIPAAGEIVDVVAGRIFHGAGLSVAGKGTVDKPGIYFPQCLITQPKPIHNAGPELFHKNIILRYEPFNRVHGLGRFQIQKHGFFIAAQPRLIGGNLRSLQKGRIMSDNIRLAAGTYFQHLGPKIRQHQRGVRAGQQRGKIKNFESVQRAQEKRLQ